MLRQIIACATLSLLAGCVVWPGSATSSGGELDPAMRWDHLPQGSDWTEASFAFVEPGAPAAILPELVPQDIETWCPAYPEADREQRSAFWVGLLSTLARHESTWNPEVVGGGGRWFGLVQISPATARFYGCNAGTGEALRDGESNLQCALRIWATTVPRDGVVAAGRGGVAADWGPFVQDRKRADMQDWISSQGYCET